ncbi:MAG: hypothetical protein JWN76_3784 [Chitinophagaceae bacterium]|nr:hypothetical protein [Chitinophagaceae bacterium]
MRKIFTFLAVSLLISAFAMAADRPGRGQLFVRTEGNAVYQMVIDGQRFFIDRNDLSLNDIRPGMHRIEIYRVQRSVGIFGSRANTELVYRSGINVSPSERVAININRFGNVHVSENRFGRDNRDFGYDDRGNGQYGNRNGRYDNRNGQYDSRNSQYDNRGRDWK